MEGLAHDDAGRGRAPAGLVQRARGRLGHRVTKAALALAFHNPSAAVKGLNIVPLADQPPVSRAVRLPGHGRDRDALALSGLCPCFLRFRRRGLPQLVLWAVVAAGPLSWSR